MTSMALAIPHTPWVPEREASMSRLREQLRPCQSVFRYREFAHKAPNRVWSKELWDWAAASGASHLLQLQDDVQVCDYFWPHLANMLMCSQTKVIGLESVHHKAGVVLAGGSNWYTTADGLIGVGYILPITVLKAFLAWRDTQLVDGWVCDEDTLIGVYCLVSGTRIWHPVPTLIDHDTSLASTYGNDLHTNRRPLLTMVGQSGRWAPKSWFPPPGTVPHLGRFYSHTPDLARRLVRGIPPEVYRSMVEDVWRGEYQ